MQSLLDKELYDHLSVIIDEACAEKKSDTNLIDSLVAECSGATNKQKKCHSCGKSAIENSKQKCPDCKAKLLTIAEIRNMPQTTSERNENKPLKIKFYDVETGNSDKNLNPISITQKKSPQEGVKVPRMLIPDPLPINPNSINNVHMVLDHIQRISGIKKGERKWIAVTCDGVPYNYAQKLKKDFPGIILIPGPLHEEMNMLKSFVELNWYGFKIIVRIIVFALIFIL